MNEVNRIKKVRLKTTLKGENIWGKGIYVSPFPPDILTELKNNSKVIEILEKEAEPEKDEEVLEEAEPEKNGEVLKEKNKSTIIRRRRR
ncbi:hypothetical protein DRO30_03605 [Candidatus Bathyarchaeota archaeon]|nr:MAG: hypothetical protein DRO30_03605 [Candidatus Bathyarchaeota archaeon]